MLMSLTARYRLHVETSVCLMSLPAVPIPNSLSVYLAQPASPSISFVVYNVFNVLADGVLTFAASTIVNTQTERSVAPATIEGEWCFGYLCLWFQFDQCKSDGKIRKVFR